MQTLYIHVMNEDGIMAEVENLPTPSDLFIKILNPRKKDGKDLHYLMEGVNTMLLPWTRITFIEVISSEQEEDVFTFVRD